MKYDDDDEYSVRMLDYATGKYEVLYSLDWFDGHINAVGMVYDSTKQAYYNVAGITEDGSSQLCRFGGNVERIECYGELAVTKPNAGAVLVDRYYYAKDPGNKDEKGISVDRVMLHHLHSMTMSSSSFVRTCTRTGCWTCSVTRGQDDSGGWKDGSDGDLELHR